jgi:hypothetical protein
MKPDIQDNDDVLFDRLVDGELSTDERGRLLASLDDRADGWRRCALAFLEAQSWGGALKAYAATPDAPLAQPSPPPVSIVPLERQSPRNSAAAWLVIAASLLVAFGLGWQANQPAGDPGVDLVVADPPRPEQVVEPAPLPRGGVGDDAITLVVNSPDGRPQRVQIPLIEGRRLGEQFAESPRWADPEVQRELAERGLDLQARRRYAPLFFEQQDRIVPMIVPVDDAVITPVSLPIY